MKSSRETISRIIRKSIAYTFKDKRKLVSLFIVVLLPFVCFGWRFVPENISFPHYSGLHIFVYVFSVNFLLVMIASAWFLTIPRRDFAMQIIATIALFFGVYLTYDTFPFFNEIPFWLDILAVLIIFLIVSTYLYYIHRNYINSKIDHKQLYDGIVHDLHHEKLLNSVSRIQGIMEVVELEEPYRSMCQEEIIKIRDAVSYVSDKYSELN